MLYTYFMISYEKTLDTVITPFFTHSSHAISNGREGE